MLLACHRWGAKQAVPGVHEVLLLVCFSHVCHKTCSIGGKMGTSLVFSEHFQSLEKEGKVVAWLSHCISRYEFIALQTCWNTSLNTISLFICLYLPVWFHADDAPFSPLIPFILVDFKSFIIDSALHATTELKNWWNWSGIPFNGNRTLGTPCIYLKPDATSQNGTEHIIY